MRLRLSPRAKKLIRYLFFFIVVSLGIFYLGTRIKPEDITGFIEKTGFWAPIIYIFMMASTFIVAPLSGTPIFLAGYVLFRSKIQIYTYFAALFAATVNFWIARRWGRKLVTKLVGKGNIEKIDQFTEDYGVKSLILLRLLQGHLHDFISYAYGLTNMRFIPFIIISALTPIPWLLLWQLYLFKRIKDIKEFTIWWLATLIPFFIISGLFALKYKKKGQ